MELTRSFGITNSVKWKTRTSNFLKSKGIDHNPRKNPKNLLLAFRDYKNHDSQKVSGFLIQNKNTFNILKSKDIVSDKARFGNKMKILSAFFKSKDIDQEKARKIWFLNFGIIKIRTYKKLREIAIEAYRLSISN